MNSENSLYKVEPRAFNKEIVLPTSKSHSNRALIIGAIRGGGFQVHNLSKSTDVTTMLSCFESIGLKISRNLDTVTFHNAFPACEAETSVNTIDLKTGDGGTTNRFLLALLSRGKKTYRLFPTEKMSERPMDDLLSPLKQLNVKIESNIGGAWLSVTGPAQMINSTKLEIDCKNSTQFATAMMLSFSTLPLTLDLKNIHASEMYIKMTEYILKDVIQKNSYTIPVDFSSLGYPLALALIKGQVLITNCLHVDQFQPDSEFIKLMQDRGADIKWTDKGLFASSKNKISPFNIDGSFFPDLVPTLAYMASHIEGKSVLSNLSVLRHKESDRLEEILTLLKRMEVEFIFDEALSSITITGSKKILPEVTLIPARDHRMVMTSYLFLRSNSGGLLANGECVEKSFPGFFEIM